MNDTDTQRFKIVLPILKTRTEIRKDEKGNEREVRFVQGVASSTDKDLHGDKMDPSAIKSMAESLKFHDVPLNADHDTTWSAEIGPVKKLEVTEDNDLVLEAELSEMSKANDLWYALTKQNKKLGLSIGGYVKEYEMVKEEEKDEDGNPTGEAHWYRLYKDIDLDHVAVTSSPANPKTWVSAISKSIDPKRDLELIKAVESRQSSTTTDKRKGDKRIKDLAHRIARKVQDIEANLLLEMTEGFLFRLNSSQIEKVENYLDVLERNMSMDKKDVSLEAEEAQAKKAVADSILGTPNVEKDENSAALDNESSSEETSEGEGAQPTPPTPPANDDAGNGESEAEEDKGGEAASSEAESSDGEASDDKGEEGDDSGESVDNDKTEGEESGDKSEESTEGESGQESTEEANSGDLAKAINGMADNIKALLKSNEELAKRVQELEGQPAQRKTVEISKDLGDDDSEEESTAENLQKSMEKEIAETKEKYASDPTLFSRIQKIRGKYALKAKGI